MKYLKLSLHNTEKNCSFAVLFVYLPFVGKFVLLLKQVGKIDSCNPYCSLVIEYNFKTDVATDNIV